MIVFNILLRAGARGAGVSHSQKAFTSKSRHRSFQLSTQKAWPKGEVDDGRRRDDWTDVSEVRLD